LQDRCAGAWHDHDELIDQQRDLGARDNAAALYRHGHLRLVSTDEEIDRRPLSNLARQCTRPARVDVNPTTAGRLIALRQISYNVRQAGRHRDRQRHGDSKHVCRLI
jgi:hypothetical protein